MENLKILNKRDIKKITNLIKSQWDSDVELNYVFLINNKNRIFIANKELFKTDFDKLRINSLGLYFGEMMDDGLRLSIEGSQIIGPKAKKQVIELNSKETTSWLKGEDLDKETGLNNYAILRHKDNFIGCGKARQSQILNYIPKNRRLQIS